MSSLIEGFGNALVEAMSAGTPVVSTRCGGPVEILEDGRCGPLVAVGDERAMAAAVEAMLDHPTPPETLRQRAAEFTVSHIAPRYLACLNLRPQFAALP